MRGGDLSNEVVPRLVLVFEGALGALDRKDQGKFARYMHRKRWREAADMWTLNTLLMQRIWYVTKHQNQTIDVVTFAGPEEFGQALEARLQDEEDLPVHRVWATRPDLLARKIAYMQDLACIYDPEQTRWLTWGPKGRILTDPNQLGAL